MISKRFLASILGTLINKRGRTGKRKVRKMEE
jgi:hypothetical protein